MAQERSPKAQRWLRFVICLMGVGIYLWLINFVFDPGMGGIRKLFVAIPVLVAIGVLGWALGVNSKSPE